MKRICVFCGASPGAHEEYGRVIRRLGRELAARRLALVYGGGNVGLMGALAQAVLEAGGEAIGVIPRKLVEMELAHPGLTTLHTVDTMHERKALMARSADAFIAAPGGFGTLDEFFEVLTWAQLGLHRKPCGLLNTRSYFTPLLGFLEGMAAQQFVQPAWRSMLAVEQDPAALLDRLGAWQPPQVDKAAWARHLTRSAADRDGEAETAAPGEPLSPGPADPG